jgi:hypothetical protein
MLQAGSISNEAVVFFFNLHNSSSRTVSLGSTQSVTEFSTKNLPGKELPARKGDLAAMCEPSV